MPLSSSFSSSSNIPLSIAGAATLPILSASASPAVFQTFPDGSRTPAGPPNPLFSEARGAFDIFAEIQHRPRPRTPLLPVRIPPVNPATGLSSAAQAGLTMPPLRAPRSAFVRPPAPANFPLAVRAPSAFRAAASSLMSSVSSLVGPWLPGTHQQSLPHVHTILAPIPSAIAHAAAQQPIPLAVSQAAAALHATPSARHPTSADDPIDVDSHKTYSELILAASTPSAANEGQADVDLMMAMTAGPAVPAAELAALLAPATLARGSAVPVATGLMPVSSTATTSTSPSPPPPPPSP